MKMSRMIVVCLVVALAAGIVPGILKAEPFKIAIMQDDRDAAQRYKPLVAYLAKKGVEASLVGSPNYPAAAKMFSAGEVDAMFSGSGVAGSMIIMDIATPVLRPVGSDGTSTYWAVVIGKKGTAKFTGSADYFAGKKVIFTALASSGEFYYHSLPGAKSVKATLLKAASHGAAIDALSKGAADVAIVKNRIWDKQKVNYQDLALIGEDNGENPDNTMIAAKKADQKVVAKVATALLGVKDDSSPEAKAVVSGMKIQGFKKTTADDFKHTVPLLKQAGVDKSFKFSF